MEAILCVRGVGQIYYGWSPYKGPHQCDNRPRMSCTHFHTMRLERFGGGLPTLTAADTTSVVSEHPSASAAEILTVHGQRLSSPRTSEELSDTLQSALRCQHAGVACPGEACCSSTVIHTSPFSILFLLKDTCWRFPCSRLRSEKLKMTLTTGRQSASWYCGSLFLNQQQAVRADMPRVCTIPILAQQTKPFPAAALHFASHVSSFHQETCTRFPPQLLA